MRHGVALLEGLALDLRLAVRALRRDWGVTLAAAAMLVLALSLNTTVFTIMDAMLFRGLPHVQRNDRLVYLQQRFSSGRGGVSYADFADWRQHARTFADLAFVGGRPVALRDADGRPQDMRVTTVSANVFGLLGVPPALGRDFTADDEAAGAAPVALVNHRFWQRRFGGRADIVGTTIRLDGVPTTIVGVMPPRFDFPMEDADELWVPLPRTADVLRRGLTAGGFTVVGRMRDGVTLRQAHEEIQAISRRLEEEHPDTNRGLRATAVDQAQFASGGDARTIWGSLWIGACFVLLIAAANVANLALARTVRRTRELATKVALGAGHGRLVRQLSIEGLVVGIAAGAAAWQITGWSVRRWAEATESVYQTIDYSIGPRTLVYLLLATVASAAVFSLAPIVRLRQLGDGRERRGGTRGTTADRRSRRVSGALVAGQMALSIVLLSGAGVLVRSYANIVGARTGVREPAQVIVGRVRLPSERYASAAARLEYLDRLASRLATVPGMSTQSTSGGLPVKFAGVVRPLELDGMPAPEDRDQAVQFVTAGPDYFAVLGSGLTYGREFRASDDGTGPPVAIVNERFASLYWPGEEPLGKRLRSGGGAPPADWRVVVGVARNVMQGDPLRQEFKPVVYVPMAQEPPARAAFFLARVTRPAGEMTPRLLDEIRGLDPDVGLESVGTLADAFAFDRDFMDPEHSELAKHAAAGPVFAVTALLLAAVGLAAVMAHSIGQRTREIGVRMAVGAAAHQIGRMVLREGMTPVAAGLLAGLAAALAVNRLLQSQLVGVSADDPLTLTAAPVILIVVALLACRLPARRAMRVDPVVALRHE